MAENGVDTFNLPVASSAAELIGNEDGVGTVRIPQNRFAAQVRATFGPIYETLVELTADLDWPANTLAAVWKDPGSNGDYVKIGAPGSGSWQWFGPSAFAIAAEKARLWAEAPEDEEVEDGEYSAAHYAAKAQQTAERTIIDATEAAASASASAAASAADASGSAVGADNSAAASASSAAGANTALLALGQALVNGVGAVSVDANGDLILTYNSDVLTDVEIDANGNLLISYEE